MPHLYSLPYGRARRRRMTERCRCHFFFGSRFCCACMHARRALTCSWHLRQSRLASSMQSFGRRRKRQGREGEGSEMATWRGESLLASCSLQLRVEHLLNAHR